MRNIHKDVAEGGTLPNSNANSDELKAFFVRVLEDYDEEKVYVSDIKKVVKWYQILAKHDLIQDAKEDVNIVEEEDTDSDELEDAIVVEEDGDSEE
jgi:hypothetical protein